MRGLRKGLFARLLLLLFAGAVVVAPVVGIAHAAEHHEAIDSVDCGTCHWAKNTAVTLSTTPALGLPTSVAVVCETPPSQPSLRLQVSEQNPRGPPAARV